MVTPAVGEVVLVRFPFSDLSQSKIRPAVCLADAGRGDWGLCQITSNAYGDSWVFPERVPSGAEPKRARADWKWFDDERVGISAG